MTAADAPRVGDKVRLTIPRPNGPAGDAASSYSPGEFVVEGPVYNLVDTLYVGGHRINTLGRTVEILERALPPEPPVGKGVVDRDGILWERDEKGWRYQNLSAPKDWEYLLRNRGPLRLVVIGDEVR